MNDLSPFTEAWNWEGLPQEWRRGPSSVLDDTLVLKWGLNSLRCKIQWKLAFWEMSTWAQRQGCGTQKCPGPPYSPTNWFGLV